MPQEPSSSQPEAQTLAQECLAAIAQALKQFGEYSYYDKGAGEVIDMERWVRRFRTLEMPRVGEALRIVLATEHGRPFCEYVVSSLDDLSDEQWEALMGQGSELADLY